MTVWPKHVESLGRIKDGVKSPVGTAGIIARALGSLPVKNGILHYNWQDALGV